MQRDLSQIDPAWAWSAYVPDAATPWSRRLAAHLHRRAGFAATWAELDAAVKAGPAATIDRLTTGPAPDANFQRNIGELTDQSVSNGSMESLLACWLYRMLNGPDPLLEKLTLFWHGHFASSAAKVAKAELMLAQNELLRARARGRFEELVRAVSRDPAMLIYLDSTTNRRVHPNENYARELMELFCLGVGNYTETDVKQVARAFTGWEVLGDAFHFNKPQHDEGEKRFLGRRGNFDGDDAIRIILEQPACPRFIARKLIRFFVFDEPAAPDALVEPIAVELRQGNFAIGPAVRRILASNLFFSSSALGRKVRSPVELGAGVARALGAGVNLVKLGQSLAQLGQGLYYPPNVKGWDGGRAWINSASLLGRANLVRQMLAGSETNFDKAGGSLSVEANKAGAHSPEETVDWLLDLLVAVPIPAEARSILVGLVDGAGGAPADRSRRIAEAAATLGAMPEFQLG